MRRLRLAIAVFAAFAAAFAATPAGSQSGSPIAISSSSAIGGTAEAFNITRVTGNSRLLVLVQTADGTAKAGIDYTAVKQTIVLARGQNSAMVVVPTTANPNALQLTFRVTAAASKVAVAATGTILEPAQTCSDGTQLPLAQTCPPPPPTTQTCPDGSVIPASSPCPVAPPPPPASTSWSATTAPLQVGSYAFLKNSGPCCNGLIVRIVSVSYVTEPAYLNKPLYSTIYVADPSGNWPATNPYWTSTICCGDDDSLQAVVAN